MKNMKVVCVVGPTAVGKTGLSLDIAEAVGGEIVSADSRQVYRGLDIGTGKIMPDEMRGIPHHLLDVADPEEVFTAADFLRRARPVIYEITGRGRVPIVVGGTGFYIDTLLGRMPIAEVPPNQILRLKVAGFSLEELQKKLKDLDPERFETIDRNNPRRLVRAIEISHHTKDRPLYPRASRTKKVRPFLCDVLWIGLAVPRAELKKKIRARLTARLKSGMLGEVKRLHGEGLSYERMEELGLEYRYLSRYLIGQLSRDDMVVQLESEIGKYAKRQMTWFKKNKEIQWFSPNDAKKIIESTKEFLQRN